MDPTLTIILAILYLAILGWQHYQINKTLNELDRIQNNLLNFSTCLSSAMKDGVFIATSNLSLATEFAEILSKDKPDVAENPPTDETKEQK